MKKTPKLPKVSIKNKGMNNDVVKYIMIILLVVILLFTIYYVYDINKAITTQEMFITAEEEDKKKDTFKIVMIYSNKCGFCEKFKPIFNSVTKFYESYVKIEQWESGSPESLEYMSKIKGVPFVLIIKNGEILATKAGLMSEAQFKYWLSPYLD